MRFGWRARIAHIEPSSAVEAAEEWRSVAPDGVIFLESRIYLAEITRDAIAAMMDEVPRATRELALARPSVIIQVGAPGIFLRGLEYERELIAQMTSIAGVPATTMMTTMVDALRTLQIRRVAVGSIYTDSLNEALARYLEALGFEVVGLLGLQETDVVIAKDHEPSVAYELGRRVLARSEGADGILISCGGLRTFEIIEPLERDTGVPVVTSNQAALWRALELSHVGANEVTRLGRLFSLSSG